MKCPDLYCGKQFIVGSGKPELFGRALTQVRGSAYVEGPEMVGDPSQFPGAAGAGNPFEIGSLMVGQSANIEMKTPPFYALMVTTFARIKSFLKVDLLFTTKIIKSKIIYTEILSRI